MNKEGFLKITDQLGPVYDFLDNLTKELREVRLAVDQIFSFVITEAFPILPIDFEKIEEYKKNIDGIQKDRR